MNFKTEPEHELLRKTVREMAKKHFLPKASYWDEHEEPPLENIPIAAQNQLLGAAIPEEYGGAGLGIVELIIIIEEVARVCANTAAYIFSANAVAQRILMFGSEEQKKKYLPDIASGNRLACHAMTEAEAGSDAANIKTTAVLDEEQGVYVMNGTKCFISRGAVSDIFLINARFSDHGNKRGMIIVERGTPGFIIGRVEPTMGFRGNPSTELILDNCRVPKENFMEKGDSKASLLSLNLSRCCNAAICLGIAEGAFEEAISYMGQREVFGRLLKEYQGLQWMVADMHIKIEAARLLIYKATFNAADGYPSALEASVAKTFSNEMAQEVTNLALQIHGSYGYSREFPLERRVRDCRGFPVAGGTTQIQRSIIASKLLDIRTITRAKKEG